MIENNTVAAEEAVEANATAEAAVAVKPKRHINQQKLQDNLWGWAFCVPLIVGTVLFIYIALVMALLLSFTVYSGSIHGNVWEFLGKMLTGGEFEYTANVITANPMRAMCSPTSRHSMQTVCLPNTVPTRCVGTSSSLPIRWRAARILTTSGSR